jgi:hypothetical protein
LVCWDIYSFILFIYLEYIQMSFSW